MPNWCENRLTVNPAENTKEALEQFEKFIDDVKEKGEVVKKEDAESYRTKFMEDNFDSQYRDALATYTSHTEMNIEKFMKEVCHFSEKEEGFTTGSSDFSMHKLLPVPLELLHPDLSISGGPRDKEIKKFKAQMREKYGFESWYDWRVANWGTKWDVVCDQIDGYPYDNNYITYYFDSAWAPPLEFLKTIAPNYPLLSFEMHYEEPGMAFEGDITIIKGEVDSESTRDMEFDDEDDNEDE